MCNYIKFIGSTASLIVSLGVYANGNPAKNSMRKKSLLIMTTALMMGSSIAHADYFNSYGARTNESLEFSDRSEDAFDHAASCEMAALTAGSMVENPLAGGSKQSVLEGEKIKQAQQKTGGLISPELVNAKAYTYDMDKFSSIESFTDQYYQDCLEEE